MTDEPAWERSEREKRLREQVKEFRESEDGRDLTWAVDPASLLGLFREVYRMHPKASSAEVLPMLRAAFARQFPDMPFPRVDRVVHDIWPAWQADQTDE